MLWLNYVHPASNGHGPNLESTQGGKHRHQSGNHQQGGVFRDLLLQCHCNGSALQPNSSSVWYVKVSYLFKKVYLFSSRKEFCLGNVNDIWFSESIMFVLSLQH